MTTTRSFCVLVHVASTQRNGQRQGDFFQGHLLADASAVGTIAERSWTVLGTRAAHPPDIHHCCVPRVVTSIHQGENTAGNDEVDEALISFYDIVVADNDTSVRYIYSNVLKCPGDAIQLTTTCEEAASTTHSMEETTNSSTPATIQYDESGCKWRIVHGHSLHFETCRLVTGSQARLCIKKYFTKLALQLGMSDNEEWDEEEVPVVCFGEMKLDDAFSVSSRTNVPENEHTNDSNIASDFSDFEDG